MKRFLLAGSVVAMMGVAGAVYAQTQTPPAAVAPAAAPAAIPSTIPAQPGAGGLSVQAPAVQAPVAETSIPPSLTDDGKAATDEQKSPAEEPKKGVKNNDMGEAYALPTWKELSQTAVLLGGLDVTEPKVADEYSKLIYCQLYQENSRNDFEWNKIRREIITRVLEKREMYRVQYQFVGVVKLERYNFERQLFPLTKDTMMVNIGSMELVNPREVLPFCGQQLSRIFPPNIYLTLNQKMSITSFKMPMDEAEKMLDKMAESKTSERVLFIRFRFKTAGIPKTVKGPQDSVAKIFLPGHIKAIDLYMDKALTKWVGSIPVIAD